MEPLTGRFDDEQGQKWSNSVEMRENEGRVRELEVQSDESSPEWPKNKPPGGDELNIVEEMTKIHQETANR